MVQPYNFTLNMEIYRDADLGMLSFNLFRVMGLIDGVTSLVSTITSLINRAVTCLVISRLESDFMNTVSPILSPLKGP